MSYTLGSLLCVFFIVCFNDETKIDNNVKCPNYCKCFNGANPDSLSIVCKGFPGSLSQDLTNISTNHHLNTLAFEEINADYFPENLFFEISFQNLILKDSDIRHISSLNSNPLKKVKDNLQTQVLTFLSSDVSEWNWSKELYMFQNIKVIHVEDCNLPEVVNFRNWSHNSLISLSLIKNGIRSIHEQEFADWPYLRIVSLSHNYIKLLNRKWFSTTLKDLWSLDLSYNKIVSLSQDFFSGMTSLRKLRLDNNKLMFLPFDPIEIIWKNGLLNQFFINNNDIECGRRNDLCWIAIESKFPNFFDVGECRISNTTQVKYFYSLKAPEVCPERKSYFPYIKQNQSINHLND